MYFHSFSIFNKYHIAAFKTSIAMKTLIFLALLSISGLSFQDILRLECQSYADFSIILHNLADTGSNLKNMITKGLRECVLSCISLLGCKAVNYKTVDGKCELVGRGLNNNLIEKTGWIYSTTDELKTKVQFRSFFRKQSFVLIYIILL